MRSCCPIRLGLLFLAMVAFLAPSAIHAQKSGTALIFYTDKQVSDRMWAPLFNAVREDLGRESYGLEPNPRLMRSTEIFPGEEFSSAVQVKLLGRCDVVQQAYRPLKQEGPLGWVLRVRGEIQPYIYIDCTRMAQVLNPTTLGLSNDERTQAMSQAIAHVLVHEWVHVATQNTGHSEHGITQAQLAPRQLVAETSTSHAVIEADSGSSTEK